MLADNGLELVATYAGGNFIFDDILPEELARVTRAADRAAELGAPHLVVGGGGQAFRRYARAGLSQAGRSARPSEGAGRGRRDCGRITTRIFPPSSKGPAEVAKIFDLTAIDFCPDTAHLAAAGGDPAQLIRSRPREAVFLHPPQGVPARPRFALHPIDRGCADRADPASDAGCGLCGLGLHRTRLLA